MNKGGSAVFFRDNCVSTKITGRIPADFLMKKAMERKEEEAIVLSITYDFSQKIILFS